MSKEEEITHRQTKFGVEFGRRLFYVPIHHLHRDRGEIWRVKVKTLREVVYCHWSKQFDIHNE